MKKRIKKPIVYRQKLCLKIISKGRRSECINEPEKVARFLTRIWDKDDIKTIESFYILCLNQSSQITAYAKISDGGLSSCMVDERILFTNALLSGATAIIVAHNHPSKNLKPSIADIKITKRIKEGCKILGFHLIDHIILCPTGHFFSFQEENLI